MPNARGALCEYMDRNGIAYSKSNKYSDFYNLVLDAAPKWRAPDHRYVAEQIMPEADDRGCRELRVWLSKRAIGEIPMRRQTAGMDLVAELARQ